MAYLHFLQGKGPNYPKNGIKAMVGAWGNPFDQHNMSNILKDRATFGGCRSWFGMPTDEGGDWRARLEGSRWVEPACGLPDWLI